MLAVRDAAGGEVTQFEALTAAAFVAFSRAGVEWAVVEAGLGGRLDATNVLPRAEVVVLTNIDLEHTELLGDTREAIAAEKLAVVRPGRSLIVGEPGWTSPVALEYAGGDRRRRRLPGSEPGGRAGRGRGGAGTSGRPGADGRGARCRAGSRCAAQQPLEIWDGAHNPAGMRRLVAELPALIGGRRPVAVFSTLGDKDVPAMVELAAHGGRRR